MVRIYSNNNNNRIIKRRASHSSLAFYFVVVTAILAIAGVTVWWMEKDVNSMVSELALLAHNSNVSSNTLLSTIQNNNNNTSSNLQPQEETSFSDAGSSSLSFNVEANSLAVKRWRTTLQEACDKASSVQQVKDIVKLHPQADAFFQMPTSSSSSSSLIPQQPRGDAAVRPCRSVVMDFGANIGDTGSHVVDSGVPRCDKYKTQTPLWHFDSDSKQFQETKRLNPLTRHLMRMMANRSSSVGPEDYCYYGIEGNPVFTKRLQELEDFVMAIRPRPIAHMHFLTESVGAGSDGPTQLYLDTINGDKNFWGSSLFENHQDVRKSAETDKERGGAGTKVAANVTGYTIKTLMRQTLLAFQPNASPHDKSNNHLVLKVDIEGGEYPLLAQEHKDGTLCEFVKMGHNNTADLFIEFHSQRVTGRNPLAGPRNKKVVEDLTMCGVKFRNLQAWWA